MLQTRCCMPEHVAVFVLKGLHVFNVSQGAFRSVGCLRCARILFHERFVSAHMMSLLVHEGLLVRYQLLKGRVLRNASWQKERSTHDYYSTD